MMINILFTDQLLDLCRQTGDLPADRFVTEQFAHPDQRTALRSQLDRVVYNQDLASFRVHHPEHVFLQQGLELPGWADQQLMAAGSSFFVKHSENIMLLLGLLSLPYCYTAANGAMVLYQSDRLRNDTARRLQDTACFIWEVMAPDAFTSLGKGFSAILKIRLIHAAGRYYTLKAGSWNGEWGVPVNQEDMAGTNLSFSLLVIRGLRKLGLAVSHHEQRGFLHLWNVIGAKLGLDTDLLPEDVKSASQLEKAIRSRQFSTSAHGSELTRSLLDYILSVSPGNTSGSDVAGLMRYLLGREVADMIHVPGPELPPYKVELIQFSNAAKSLKPTGDILRKYRRDYHGFKMQQQPPADARGSR